MEKKTHTALIRSFTRHGVFVSLYLFLTLLVFHPVAASPATLINGTPDDTYAILWHLWWFKHSLLDLHTLPSFSAYVESPFGIGLTHTTIVNRLIALPFTALWGPVAAYNIMTLASFFLAGLAMYLLAFEVTGNRTASFFAGLVYSFSPYHMVFSALGGMDGAQIQYMPLVLFFLIRYEKHKGPFYLLALLTSLFLALFSFGYYAVLTLLMVSLFYLYIKILPTLLQGDSALLRSPDAGIVRLHPEPLRVFFITIIIYIFAVLADNTLELIPGAGPLLPLALVLVAATLVDFKRVLPGERGERSGKGDAHNFKILAAALLVFVLGALVFLFPVFSQASRNVSSTYLVPLLSYIFPAPDHPLLGGLVPSYLIPSPDPLSGRMVHLGVVVPALALFALFAGPRRWHLMQYFIILLIAGALFSLPPVIRLNEFTFYNPFYYLHAIVPPFVDIRRVVLLILIPLSIISSVGVVELFQRMPFKALKAFLFSLLVVAAGVEFFPRITPVDMTGYPAAYDWLANKRGDFTVVEFPLTSIHDPKRYEPFYGQTIHHKRLINPFGVLGHDPAPSSRLLERFMKRGGPLNEPFVNPENTGSALKFLGVRYALVRTDKFGASPRLNGPAFKEVVDLNDSSIYEVTAQKMDIFFTHVDFYRSGYFLNLPPGSGDEKKGTVLYRRPEPSWKDGKVWLWMGRRGAVRVWGFNADEKTLRLDFTARSAGPSVVLSASVNGKKLSEFLIGPHARRYSIENLKARPFVKDLVITFEIADEKAFSPAEGFYESIAEGKETALIGAAFTDMVLTDMDSRPEDQKPYRYDGLYMGEV